MKRRELIKGLSIFPLFNSGCTLAGGFSIKNLDDFANDEVRFYAVFFSNEDESIGFYFSSNGVAWRGPIKFFDGGSVLKGRDPSIFFYKGSWYIFTTGNKYGITDFIAYETNDLNKEWKTHYIKLDGQKTIVSKERPWGSGDIPTKYLWAPKLCKSFNGLYLFTCVELSYDTNFPNSEKLFFGVYISTVINIDVFKFSIPKRVDLIELSGEVNKFSRIDPYVIYDSYNDNYIMCVKRETFGILDFFLSDKIDGPYNYLSSFNLRMTDPHASIEGGGVYYNGKEWVIIFDRYVERKGIQYVTTNDFNNFSSVRQFSIDFSEDMRHGDVKAVNSY